jgi:hypothetical protein
MKYVLSLGVGVLLLTLAASAQINPANYTLMSSPIGASSAPMALGFGGASSTTTVPPPEAPFPIAFAPASGAGSAAMPQAVARVFETYSWQAYLGYTFFRFYETPQIEQNLNGFNGSVVYYLKDWLGADGEFMATFGSQSGFPAHYVFGGGGPRFRWLGPRGIELWGHGLLGYVHFTPQTALGPQGAFAYELGGGADLNLRNRRWALRIGADMLGSRFFSTYQFSPKISTGIVFKF